MNNVLVHTKQELSEREAVISQHEVLLKEKREFEKKSIHSNHKDSQKMMHLSLQIESLDSSIREKEHLRGTHVHVMYDTYMYR